MTHPTRTSASGLAPDSLAYALTLAADLIQTVIEGGALTEAFPACWRTHPDCPHGTRGAVMDLTYGTLRDFGHGDFLLGQLLHKPLDDGAVHALLLVALHRLERRPDQAHVVVDQAVQAAALIRRGVMKGLVNAVLRNFLRQGESLLAAAATDDVASLCHPQWWLRALQRDFADSWRATIAAGNSHPPMGLRVNRRRASREAVLAQFAQAGVQARALGADGIVLDTPRPVTELPGFAEGLLSVQDIGAQHAAPWLGASDGMRVLDACAAPGGKTAHLLECCTLDLLALDADAARAARIDENLHRLGLAAQLKVADCRDTAQWWDKRPFDRILADVPCSASGVARRHPDIKWLRRADDIRKFARLQREILDAMWPLLAPGGQMLYATCSVFRAENQDQVAAFCVRHADAEMLPLEGQPMRTLLPCAEHDGFFYALIKKRL